MAVNSQTVAQKSLGQALNPADIKNVPLALDKTPTYTQSAGRGGMVTGGGNVLGQYDQYREFKGPGGRAGSGPTGYSIPTQQTYKDIPLVAKYDMNGNFQYMTFPEDKYLNIDPNDSSIISQPKINANGEITDYGIAKQGDPFSGGMFGGFIDSFKDLSPLLLAGLGANLFGGMNLLGGAGELAGAAGGATAADIAANNALAAANTAGYAGTSLGSTAAGAGLGAGTLADIATSSPVIPQTALTGTPLADLAAGITPEAAAAAGGASATDIAAHQALAAANTAAGLTPEAAAAAAASAGAGAGAGAVPPVEPPPTPPTPPSPIPPVPPIPPGASASDIAANDALAKANLTAQAAGQFNPSAGAGSFLSNLLPDSLKDLLPTTPAGMGALLSGAGNVVSGLIGGSAAEKAAQIQADAAKTAAANTMSMFNTLNAQQAPYRASGYGALNKLAQLGGGSTAQYDANGNRIADLGVAANNPSYPSLGGISAGSSIAPTITPPSGWQKGNDFGSPSPFGTPYTDATGAVVGYLGSNGFVDKSGNPAGGSIVQNAPDRQSLGGNAPSDYLTQQFGPEQFAAGMDPGYAFRLQQGQMANQRASNLAGGLIGGNALKGMQDYTQGMASQEYGNAFNRFQTQRTNIFNTLASIAGIGQTAQGQTNQMGQNAVTAQGQLGVGSAAAQAAGQIGQANAYGGAATGAGNAYLLSQLLKQNQGVAQG